MLFKEITDVRERSFESDSSQRKSSMIIDLTIHQKAIDITTQYLFHWIQQRS